MYELDHISCSIASIINTTCSILSVKGFPPAIPRTVSFSRCVCGLQDGFLSPYKSSMQAGDRKGPAETSIFKGTFNTKLVLISKEDNAVPRAALPRVLLKTD